MRFAELERKTQHIPLILKLDVSGLPVKWIGYREATTAHWNGKVLWSLGAEISLRGGMNRMGEESIFMLPSIIACDESRGDKLKVPPLTNVALFKRDRHQCQYCTKTLSPGKLTRDHIIPTSRGGENVWTNVCTACRDCNHYKANRTPEEAHMQLIAVPYVPSVAEKLIFENRKILADQSEYLKTMIPPSSPYWKRHFN